MGADYSLSVVPYYNKPTQEGLYRHFRAIAEAVDLPMIVYNVPGRTVADLQNETVLRLAQVPNIVGIKDATANLERGSDLVRRKPRDFRVYSGDDATGLPLVPLGGHVMTFEQDYLDLLGLFELVSSRYAQVQGRVSYSLDFEFKKVQDGGLIVKQVRPLPLPDTTRDVTPFLLDRLAALTAGRTVAANLALLRGNARLAAELAVALARQAG